MKPLFRALIAFAVLGAIVYLIGSFMSASFDLAAWHPALRGFTGFIGGIGAIAVAVAVYNDEL